MNAELNNECRTDCATVFNSSARSDQSWIFLNVADQLTLTLMEAVCFRK